MQRTKIETLLEAGAVGITFLMPLAFWPSAELPFSTAKLWLLAAWLVVGYAAAGASGIYRGRPLPARLAIGLSVWISSVALSAVFGREVSLRSLVDSLLPCGNVMLLLWIAPKTRKIMAALIASATVVAGVAVLQYLRLDPFDLLGLEGSMRGNSRILVFSTLGNPNFVASFLVSVLPLTVVFGMDEGAGGRKAGRLLALAALIQAGAILATGSRAPVPALAAAGVWLIARRHRSRLRLLIAGVAVAATLLTLSPARPLGKTIAGRLYIWKVVAGHAGGIPIFGFGPGAFPLRFAEWETERMRLPGSEPDREFTGLQDHAHNDYIEFAVEHGIVGLAAFATLLVFATRVFGKKRIRRGTPADGIVAGLISLLAAATVDFPLHRPAELYLLWSLIAMLWIGDENKRTPAQPDPGRQSRAPYLERSRS